jgi:mono/diheme cytochrome c family protein
MAALLLAPATCVAQSPAAARAAFQDVCGACHSVETVTSQRRTRAQWQESINSMVARGAKGTDEQFALILDYLTRQYGPASPNDSGASPAAPAPAGPGTGRRVFSRSGRQASHRRSRSHSRPQGLCR